MAPLISDNVEWKSKLLFIFCMVVSLGEGVVEVVVVGRGWEFDAMNGRVSE